MKSRGHLFGEFCSLENLLAAARQAMRGKRNKASTSAFELRLEENLLKLQAALRSGSYRCGTYTNFYIYEPKRRYISAAPYVDRVVHHALCNVMGPIFEGTFVHHLYSNRKEKGTHKAVDQYQRFCRLNQYVLKCDIRDYFASVDKTILLRLIERKIKDPHLIKIVAMVIDSFVKDPNMPGKGMPLGNLTSQLFANLYLCPMDHFIKEQLGCLYYIRYTDDFVIFDNDKQRLHDAKAAIADFLKKYRLLLHPNKSQIYRVSDGVTFLGYRVFPQHRLLRKSNVRRYRRHLKVLQKDYASGQVPLKKVLESLNSWNAHAAHADSYRLRENLYGAYTFAKG